MAVEMVEDGVSEDGQQSHDLNGAKAILDAAGCTCPTGEQCLDEHEHSAPSDYENGRSHW